MLEVDLIDVVSFVRQASGAVAGAGGLHGYFLFSRGKRELFRVIDQNTVIASVIFILAWVVGWVIRVPEVAAHVGISLEPTGADFIRGYAVSWPLVLVLIALILTSKWGFNNRPKAYNLAYFVVMSLLLSTYGVAASVGTQEISYILHGWHSILTLGTVVVLDYLFFACRNNLEQLKMLNETFGRFTLFIFVGLGLDLLSTYMILPEALKTSQRFFFVQTLLAVLIVNGALLSGPMTRAAAKYLSTKRELPRKLHIPLGLMGAISLVSWTAITFLDFVQDVVLSYWQLAVIYIALIVGGFITHLVVDGWPFGTKRVWR